MSQDIKIADNSAYILVNSDILYQLGDIDSNNVVNINNTTAIQKL